MRRVITRVHHELTRPRGRTKHRFYRADRSSRSGVALLMVLTSIMLMTLLVAEIAHAATVRVQLAIHHRDEAQAEMLAYSGVQFYRLILVGSKAIGKNPMIATYGQMLGVNADTLWQAIPFINTSLLRMLFVTGGGDVDEEEAQQLKKEGLSDEQREESREDTGFKRNFLDFDGDFSAEVVDEDRQVFVGKFKATDFTELLLEPATIQLLGMMSGEKHDEYFRDSEYDRMELIANLADWTDIDNNRLYQGGLEDSVYQNLEEPYLPKNAPFDTTDEIRLIDGWHRDGVWERYGKHLTIYGDQKINVNTADRAVLRGLVMAYVEPQPVSEEFARVLVDFIMEFRSIPPEYCTMPSGCGQFRKAQDFKSFLEAQGAVVNPDIVKAVKTESTIFRVTAAGEVRDSKVVVEAVYDFSKSNIGKLVYWRIR